MSRCISYERHASEIVDDSVTLLRNRGYTRQTAARECAAWLGTTARRVQALLFGEPVRVDAEELAELRTNYMRLLDDEVREISRRNEKLQAKLQELRGILNEHHHQSPSVGLEDRR